MLIFEVPDVDIGDLDESELRALLGQVRVAQRRLDALTLRIGTRANELAAQGRSAPAKELLLGNGQVRAGTAHREAARTDATANLPGLANALASGRVGTDHVDAIIRRTKPLTNTERDQLDTNKILADASRLPADTFDAALKTLVEQTTPNARLRDHHTKRQASEFRHWYDHHAGMGRFTGQLDPERYEAFTTAIDQHTATLAKNNDHATTRNANLAAQALTDLVSTSTKRQPHLPHIIVIIDYETLKTGWHDTTIAQTNNGHDLPPQTISRLACDATIRRVTTSNDKPIGTGRTYRTATNAQWDAIRTNHSTCAWPSCNQPLTWCQIHHILEWKNGGQNTLDNLVPLCNQHHHAVHEGNWTIRQHPNRTIETRRPDNQPHTTATPPTRKPQPAPTEPTRIKDPTTDSKPNSAKVAAIRNNGHVRQRRGHGLGRSPTGAQ